MAFDRWKQHEFFALVGGAVVALASLSTAATADDRHDCATGSPDLRIAACTKVLQANARDFNALANRGISYRAIGKYDNALVDLNEAVRIDPNSAGLRLERGLALDAAGDHEHAIADFSEAIRRDAGLVQAYFGRAMAYEAGGQGDLAADDLNKATQLNRTMVAAFYMERGYVLQAGHHYDGALLAFDKAIELGPNWLSAYFGRGATYEEKGELVQAAADYRKCLEVKATTALELQRQQTAREHLDRLGRK